MLEVQCAPFIVSDHDWPTDAQIVTDMSLDRAEKALAWCHGAACGGRAG
jgi:hypothetical protein